jgi:hypothetical protein
MSPARLGQDGLAEDAGAQGDADACREQHEAALAVYAVDGLSDQHANVVETITQVEAISWDDEPSAPDAGGAG